MLLKKKNINTAIIGIILILMCHIFYLVNIPDGLWLLLYLILAGIVYLKYFKVKVKSARYSAIIILGIFMIIISSISGTVVAGNPARVIGTFDKIAEKRYKQCLNRPCHLSSKNEIDKFFWQY